MLQGYHGDKQLAYVKSGKGHHKTFDDISKFADGLCDELMLAYVKEYRGSEPSVDNFFLWLETKENNLTVQFLAQQCLHFDLGIQLFRRGRRFNCERLSLLGWCLCVPFVHCRNHPKCQLLDILSEIDNAAQPPELRALLSRNFTASRYSNVWP